MSHQLNFFSKKIFNNLSIILFEIVLIYLSYFYLWDPQRCTKNIPRSFLIFNYSFDIYYPKMCDEPYYFQGFEFLHSIYQNGYPYQDKQLYLFFGYIFFHLLKASHELFQLSYSIETLLLSSSLLLQIVNINLISYLLTKIILKKKSKFYFLIFFVIIFFSFEQRKYFFLPSNSTYYFLIYLFSIYSIIFKKNNSFLYGSLFLVSGYAVVGFIFQNLFNLKEVKRKLLFLTKNLIIFILPYLSFELIRLIIKILSNDKYGQKYIYTIEAYNQFVWFFKDLLLSNYVSTNTCQNITNFIFCYLKTTIETLNLLKYYIILLLLLFLFSKFTINERSFENLSLVFKFTIFLYFFILFQGMYETRFVYYSIGFCLYLLICVFIVNIKSRSNLFLYILIISFFTLSKTSLTQFEENIIFRDQLLIYFLIITFTFEIMYYKKIINFKVLKRLNN